MLVYILIIHCLWPSHTIKSAVTYVSFLTKQIIYGNKNIKLLDIYKHINKKQHKNVILYQMYPLNSLIPSPPLPPPLIKKKKTINTKKYYCILIIYFF